MKKKVKNHNISFSRGPEFVLVSRRNRVFKDKTKYSRKRDKGEES